MQASGGRRSCVPTGKYDGSISAPPLGPGQRPFPAQPDGTMRRRVLRCRVAAQTTVSLGAGGRHALTDPLRTCSKTAERCFDSSRD